MMQKEIEIKAIPIRTLAENTVNITGLLMTENGEWWYNDNPNLEVLKGNTLYELYFLSDNEIKGGDYIWIHSALNEGKGHFDKIVSLTGGPFHHPIVVELGFVSKENIKKIVTSTDESLKLARPSDEFLREYCELGGIDKCLVDCEKGNFRPDIGEYGVGEDDAFIFDLIPKIVGNNTINFYAINQNKSN